MFLMMSLAMAGTPAELAAAVPGAQEQLEQCRLVGCDADDGARAAWVLAVDTYVREGRADAALAGTVRALDADLFADLPDVVRDAAGQPLDWAVQGPQTPPVALKPHVPLEECDKTGSRLEILVTDVDGVPIGHAGVRFPDEGEIHMVHTVEGTWMGSVLYLKDGGERCFAKGDNVRFDVFAPGYDYTQVNYVAKKKRNPIHIVLRPWEPVAPSPEVPVARAALEAWDRWSVDLRTAIGAPHADWKQVHEAQTEAAHAARAWLDAGGGSDAHKLCLMAGTESLCGPL